MRLRVIPAALGLAVVLATASPVEAQSIDPAAATELFKQGRTLMEQGNYEAACPKFAESARLDAKVGTLLNLAECEEKLGKLADARQHLQLAIDRARVENDDRLTLATDRLAAIDPRVPRLTIALAAGSPAGAIVERDGVALGAASLDNPLPVNPGDHTVVVKAAGYEPKTFTVKLKESEKQRLEVSTGARLPESPASTTVATPTTAPEEAATSGKTTRTWGFIVGGLGVVGLGVGTAFGLIALSKNSESKNNGACDSNNICDSTGKDARDQARSAGNVSTVAFIAGGIAVAAGAFIVLTAPSSEKPHSARIEAAPLVGASTGGLVLQGAW